MSGQRPFHLQRFRDWLDASIANRLTFAAVAMTMSVVGVVGLVAFIIGYLQIERSVHNELSAELELFERRLETSLGILQKDLTSLSGNTLVSSGLLDSQGRETYLNPFLRDYRSPLGTPVTLSLHDFQGGAIAGNNPGGLPSFRNAPWVEKVVAEARPHAEIFPGTDGNYLLLAYPVFYPSTGRAEGILVAELNLSKLFRGDSAQGNSRIAKHLLDGSGRHAGEQHNHEVAGGDFVLRKPLKLAQPLAAFGIQVEVSAARGEMLAPLYWMIAIYLVVGSLTLLFVLWATRRGVARLIQPLVELSETAEGIAASNLAAMQVPVRGKDEIGKLAQSFNGMIRGLRDSYQMLEQRVSERTSELRELNDTLEKRVRDEIAKSREKDLLLIQQSRLAALGEMIGNIAHQWRQPLNTIGLLFTNIKDAYDFDDLSEAYLEECTQNGMRLTQQMSTTIDDFRNFFRPNREKVRFGLNKSVREALAIVESGYGNDHIELVWQEGEDVSTDGFPSEYSQVLLNLLANARDAILSHQAAAGRVTISTARDGENALLSVRDNGGGIPADVLPKIFDPYFTTKEKGTGIGLYMSKMIIETNMNGRIEAHNIGGGAEFTVITPLA